MAEVVIDGNTQSTVTATVPPNTAHAPIDTDDTTSTIGQTQGGQDNNDAQVNQVSSPSPEPGTGEGGSFVVAGVDVTSFSQEYERDGKLSDNSYKALAEKGFPREMVDAYIRGIEGEVQTKGQLAQKEVSAILDEVGGEERYNKIMAWAASHLSKQEQEAYDRMVTNPDPAYARLAVQGLINRYEQQKGHSPSLVMGSRAPDTPSGFKNRSEMIKAMSDKRYGTDPEYTREVELKVRSSGIMRGRM